MTVTLPPGLELPQLVAAATLGDAGLGDRMATVELFFRGMPAEHGFLVTAGQEEALDLARGWELPATARESLAALPGLGSCTSATLDRLCRLRCTGDLWAMEEGTVAFPGEPVLRITAPLLEALLLGAAILPVIRLDTQVATRAARMALAAQGRPVLDAGSGHDPAMRLRLARAAILGGLTGTTCVTGILERELPPPGGIILTLEEGDPLEPLLEALQECTPWAVQLEGHALATRAQQVRQRLEEEGRPPQPLFAAGPLQERDIEALGEAPVDGFVIHTSLAAPPRGGAVEATCQLVDLEGDTSGQAGVKQAWRHHDEEGEATEDLVGLAEETPEPPGSPLLQPMLRAGERVHDQLPLEERCRRVRGELADLPAGVRRLEAPDRYQVRYSEALLSRLRRDGPEVESPPEERAP